MTRPFLYATITICILALVSSPCTADWKIVASPVTGNPEAVWSNTQGQSTDILYSYLDGENWAPATTLSGAATQTSSPALAFDEEGGRKVVWDTVDGEILIRTLSPTGGSWSSEILLSESTESASRPSVVVFSGDTHVSYETTTSAGRRVKVSKMDPGSNVERSLVATSTYSSPVEPRLHTEDGLLWIDWIDSDTNLGYSEFAEGAWRTVYYEAYEGSGDVSKARERIRDHFLN